MTREEAIKALIKERKTALHENKQAFDMAIKALEQEPTVNAIFIPNRATNGDMIEAMFPNCEQKEHMHNGYFEMYFDNDLKNASYMRVSKDWWRAPYKVEIESEE